MKGYVTVGMDDALESCYGPFASIGAAKVAIDTATGGRFKTKLGTKRPPCARHGPRQYVVCNAGADAGLLTAKCCSWFMYFECTEDPTTGDYAFYMWKFTGEHRPHNFLNTKAEKMTNPGYRQIPAKYLEFADVLAKSGIDCPGIHRALCTMAEKEDHEVNWELKDIQNKFANNNSNKTFDAQGLHELLEERKRQGLDYRLEMTDAGRLGCVVAEVAGGREAYARDGKSVCLMLDTTHGCNVYDVKVGLYTLVDAFGNTVIVMISLIYASEDSDKFIWCFNKFLDIYIVPPAVILTDSCPKMALAIVKVFPTTKHLLCVFHISGNFFDHIHGIVGKEWHAINSAFWKLAKETDVRSVNTFDAEFKTLENLIREATATSGHLVANPKKVDLAMTWLSGRFYEKREQWAYRWTWSSFTVGCHSTQRSESIHSAIKRVLRSSNFSLVQMFTILSDYQSDRDFFGDLKRIRDAAKVHQKNFGAHLEVLKTEVNSYALAKLQEQYNQVLFYSMQECHGSDGALLGWDVKRRTVLVQEGSSVPSSSGDDISAQAFGRLGDTLVDSGLNSESGLTSRFVSITGTCSCQNKITVGITCRHNMVCSQVTQHQDLLGNARFIGGAVGSRYALLDTDTGARQRNIDATRGLQAADDSPASTEMTKQERERQLHALAAQVVSVGKSDVALTRFVADGLADLLRQVQARRPASVPISLPVANGSSPSVGPAKPTIANPPKQTTKVGKAKRLKGEHSQHLLGAAKAEKKRKTAEQKAAAKLDKPAKKVKGAKP